MRIAITGGRGRIGRAITADALAAGHSVVNVDRIAPDAPAVEGQDVPPPLPTGDVRYLTAEMADYDAIEAAFAGCDAMVHMAAILSPLRDPDHVVHNNNVVGSYNALRAAAGHGIRRVCQGSSVNATGHAYSRQARYDYFPLDEQHPNYAEDPYSLSKWLCEEQGASIARRYEDMRIASMRFHWVAPSRELAAASFNKPGQEKNLWAYTALEAASRACLLSLEADYEGHEVFYIVAHDSVSPIPSRELARTFFPEVALKDSFGGHDSFFSSQKAERMLGWTHPPRD